MIRFAQTPLARVRPGGALMLLAAALLARPALAESGRAPAATVPFGRLPLYFEASGAAPDTGFAFLARGRQCNFAIAPDAAVLTLSKFAAPPTGNSALRARHLAGASTVERAVRFQFVGAQSSATVIGLDGVSGKVNYLLGNEPAAWRRDVPLFSRVRVTGLYRGVDLVYYPNETRLEYDFVVAPQADPGGIVMDISGADEVRVEPGGDLVLKLGADEIRQPRPVVYQMVQGARTPVAGDYRVSGGHFVSFQIGPYDHELPLVIDPILRYGSFFGGSGVDVAYAVAVDAEDFVYVTGESMGGIRIPSGVVSNRISGATLYHGDVFVAKFDNTGSNLVYLTYVGGNTAEVGLSLAVDGLGNAYVTGYSDSTNFPTSATNSIYRKIKGQPLPTLNTYPIDCFVFKLDPSGTNLVYSTFLGGDQVDEGVGIAIDPLGAAYVTGYTESWTNFPIVNASQALTNYGGNGDAFVAKIDPAGSNLVYCFYLGQTNQDVGSDIAVDEAGVAFVAGYTRSTNFPAAVNLPHGGVDVFLTAIDATNTPLTTTNLRSYYFGGTADEGAYRITLAGDNLYLTGAMIQDTNFVVHPGQLNPGGVYRSDDGGSNWTLASQGMRSVVVSALAMQPGNPASLAAATLHGVAQSFDGGATWSGLNPNRANLAGFAPAAAAGAATAVALGTAARVYVGTTNEWVSVSATPGASLFATTNTATFAATSLAADPVNPLTVFAGSDFGVYRSTDGGTNWVAFNTGLGSYQIQQVLLTSSNLYVATSLGVYRSTNNSAAWVSLSSGLLNPAVQALALKPGAPPTLYAGTPSGAFVSTNGGTNWSLLNGGLTCSNLTALAVDPTGSGTVYAGTTNGLFKLDGSGTNWVAATNGLGTGNVRALLINPAAPQTIYAGTKGQPYFGSNDVFIAKFDKSGQELYSAVLGGAGNDEGWDIAVDAAGGAHVVGWTDSTNFQTAEAVGFLRTTKTGATDAFVAQLSPDGSSLVHGAYLGGTGADFGYGIALDSLGHTFLVGGTASSDFPVFDALQSTNQGSSDAFLVKLMEEPLPSLEIVPFFAISGAVYERLSWPAFYPDFVVQSTTNFVPISSTNAALSNTWSTFSAPRFLQDGRYYVYPQPTNSSRFFRLKHQ